MIDSGTHLASLSGSYTKILPRKKTYIRGLSDPSPYLYTWSKSKKRFLEDVAELCRAGVSLSPCRRLSLLPFLLRSTSSLLLQVERIL
jgi:hypothetical protein